MLLWSFLCLENLAALTFFVISVARTMDDAQWFGDSHAKHGNVQSSSSQCAWSQSSKFLELEQWFQLALRMKIRQRWKKTECRPLKTFRMWGKMHIPIPKSHFYHRLSAHARNYGKMRGSHLNLEKLTIDFMLRRHYKCAFYTVICGIFITSLLSDLSLRVVTYDRTVVLDNFFGQWKTYKLYMWHMVFFTIFSSFPSFKSAIIHAAWSLEIRLTGVLTGSSFVVLKSYSLHGNVVGIWGG